MTIYFDFKLGRFNNVVLHVCWIMEINEFEVNGTMRKIVLIIKLYWYFFRKSWLKIYLCNCKMFFLTIYSKMTLCIESVFTIYGCANKNVFSKTSNTFLYSFFFFWLVKLITFKIQYISLTLGFPLGSTDEEWFNMGGC